MRILLLGFPVWVVLALFPTWALPQSVQDHQKNDRSKRVSGLYTGPYFDPSTPKTITAQAGSSAFLLCKVKQLENKSVSWVRRTDAHILAVNQQIFIRDPRFHIRQAKRDPGLWTLQIRQVKKSDAGDYECQISTEPKRSWLINLKVVVPEVKLIGGPDIFVQRGSGVELRCQVSDASEKRFIFWFKDDRRILDGDIQVSKFSEDVIVETLRIENAKPSDAGNYTCNISDEQTASVMLHVLDNGEHSQAMQRDRINHSSHPRASDLLFCLLLVFSWIFYSSQK